MSELRKPFFFVALVAILLVVLGEIGSGFFLPVSSPSRADFEAVMASEPSDPPPDVGALFHARRESPPRPGLAIQALALLDGLVLLTAALMGLALLVPERIHGRIQGIVQLVVCLLIAVASFAMIFADIALLLVMVSLFLAVPFGTLAYLAIWGFFERGAAAATLSLLMLLKIIFAVCLGLAHQRFLERVGLILLVITSLLGNVIVSFLHGLVPGVLVSITDALAAIVVAVISLIWAIVMLVFAVIAVIKAIA